MTILFKGISFSLVCSLALVPFSTQAWFFPSASAQDRTSDTPDSAFSSDTNAQMVALLSPTVAMTSMDRDAVDMDAEITIVDGSAMAPSIGSSGTLADFVDDTSTGDITVYTVKSGDTVPAIAKMFGVSENTVRWANDLKKGAPVHVGDTLLILPFNGIKYTVAKGDTLAGIEKRFALTGDEINELLDYNDLSANAKLTIGQQLVIPGAELATVAATKTTSKIPATSKTATTTNVTRGYYIRPVPTSCRMSQGKHDNYAVDLACPIGTPIKAAASGTVEFAREGYNGGYGNLVILKHSNSRTYYAHIVAGGIKVSAGESVTQGQVIGLVGSTGRSTGPHVHFEVRGSAVNPGFDRTGSAWKQ